MSHGSYVSNLGSEILILGEDIRSRTWLNIGDSYSICSMALPVVEFSSEGYKIRKVFG